MLPRRLEETLQLLLIGKSEKQVAAALGISQHTVHVYVKQIYKQQGVCSRPELLAKLLTTPSTSNPTRQGESWQQAPNRNATIPSRIPILTVTRTVSGTHTLAIAQSPVRI
jgi:hypothetical protein